MSNPYNKQGSLPRSVPSLEFAERYSRQILFPPIGPAGQKKLAAARIAIVGCGATGSAMASLLCRAGVGTLRIIDRDYVEPRPRARGASPKVKLAAGVKAAWFRRRLVPQTYLPCSAPKLCPEMMLGRLDEPVAPSPPAKMPDVQPGELTLSGVPLWYFWTAAICHPPASTLTTPP